VEPDITLRRVLVLVQLVVQENTVPPVRVCVHHVRLVIIPRLWLLVHVRSVRPVDIARQVVLYVPLVTVDRIPLLLGQRLVRLVQRGSIPRPREQ